MAAALEGFQELKQDCSGVLISQRHILTAAHCVTEIDRNHEREQCAQPLMSRRFEHHPQKRIWTIFVGSKCANPEQCHLGRRVSKISINPYYDSCDNLSDLAIVELSRKISEYAATPICMPNERTKLQKTLRVAGAGIDPYTSGRVKTSRRLQVIDVSLIDVDSEHRLIHTRNSSAWTCSGDSGGPLFQLDKNRRYTLVGTVSSASGLCENDDRDGLCYLSLDDHSYGRPQRTKMDLQKNRCLPSLDEDRLSIPRTQWRKSLTEQLLQFLSHDLCLNDFSGPLQKAVYV